MWTKVKTDKQKEEEMRSFNKRISGARAGTCVKVTRYNFNLSSHQRTNTALKPMNKIVFLVRFSIYMYLNMMAL
jgi:hypothetical protein